MPKFVRMVCETCGSSDVLADAYAEWDTVTQEWGLQNTFDKGAHCNTCDGETRLADEPLDGDDLNEARAHYLALEHGWLPGDEDTAIQYCDTEDLDYTADIVPEGA